MPTSQQHIGPGTPTGANLVVGATFRVWAPVAKKVYISGSFNDFAHSDPELLHKGGDGYWAGFVPGVKDGDQYKFWVVGEGSGEGSRGFKRDPYARELVPVPGLPDNCIIRDPNTFPWHDQGFRPPAFNDLIIYQFHIGTYYGRDAAGNDDRRGRDCTFLDVIDRIEYLVELGINAIEPLPINEFETETSQGYNGSDLFAPEFRYTMLPGDPRIPRFLATINRLLGNRGQELLGQPSARSLTPRMETGTHGVVFDGRKHDNKKIDRRRPTARMPGTGTQAMGTCEPGQDRKGAAISGAPHVLWDNLLPGNARRRSAYFR